MTWRIGILKKLNSINHDWIYILQTWVINTHGIYIINLGHYFSHFRNGHFESQKLVFLDYHILWEEVKLLALNDALKEWIYSTAIYIQVMSQMYLKGYKCGEGNKYTSFEKQYFEWVEVNSLILILSLRHYRSGFYLEIRKTNLAFSALCLLNT